MKEVPEDEAREARIRMEVIADLRRGKAGG
jgi:hypothetical protein